MEAAPVGMNPAEIGARTAALEHVVEVHDLHIWEVTSGYAALSAHVLVTPGADCHAIRLAAERMFHDTYGIGHTTLQVDHTSSEALTIDGADAHCRDPHGPTHHGGATTRRPVGTTPIMRSRVIRPIRHKIRRRAERDQGAVLTAIIELGVHRLTTQGIVAADHLRGGPAPAERSVPVR
ncbi:hypothetical protein ACFQX6_09815 [Streptosporangium lutulentum]